jgi:dienelactone hydrolase
VLAPNVFYRAGRSPVEPGMDFAKIRPLIAELTPERLGADGAAYLDYLAEVASPGPVGVTGYCMGGRVGWWIAAAHPDRVAALAAFHTAGLVTDAPESPHRRAGDVTAELYFGFADQDPGMTDEQIATFERALDEAGVRYRAEVYEPARLRDRRPGRLRRGRRRAPFPRAPGTVRADARLVPGRAMDHVDRGVRLSVRVLVSLSTTGSPTGPLSTGQGAGG